MGWAFCGEDSQGREIGYAIAATCDHPGCNERIDRGLSYACGGEHGVTEWSCERYFCPSPRDRPDAPVYWDDRRQLWAYQDTKWPVINMKGGPETGWGLVPGPDGEPVFGEYEVTTDGYKESVEVSKERDIHKGVTRYEVKRKLTCKTCGRDWPDHDQSCPLYKP